MADTPTIPELLSLALIRQHYIPLGVRTLFRMISVGDFPRADIAIGAKVRMWRRETIEQWIESRAGARR